MLNTRVYLNDWFFNAGVIGFIRILEYNKADFLVKKDNYIEFDTANLKNFHKYYFKYFFDTYNVGERFKNSMIDFFERVKILTEGKEIREKIKKQKKYIKIQLDKIKKIDDDFYERFFEAYNEMDQIKEKEDLVRLKEIVDILVEISLEDKINKKITSNLFKSILSNSYFGQKSFLNVIKNSLSYEEQIDSMYKDYVSNIVEMDVFQHIMNDEYDQESLKKLIEEKIEDKLISEDVLKYYKNIYKKYLLKNKSLEEIKTYIKENVFENCSLCGEVHFLTSDYTEGNFIPLAVSSENAQNFFWNQNVKFPICDLCKLILFCIPAGVTSLTKIVRKQEKDKKINNRELYSEEEVFSFVNYDTSVKDLLKENNQLSIVSKADKFVSNPYGDLILNIIEKNKEISEWELQNIFVVEFKANYDGKFSRIEYFNIQRYVARFFMKYSHKINGIMDYKYKLQLVDCILKGKDFINVINNRLRQEMDKERPFGLNSFLATEVRCILKILKKEENKVEELVKNANNKIGLMYSLGNDIHDELKRNNNDNKLNGYIYRMLNCIKTNNKNEFMDIVIRVLWSSGKDIPQILVKEDENVDWKDLGHGFIAGLTSAKYVKGENKGVEENV